MPERISDLALQKLTVEQSRRLLVFALFLGTLQKVLWGVGPAALRNIWANPRFFNQELFNRTLPPSLTVISFLGLAKQPHWTPFSTRVTLSPHSRSMAFINPLPVLTRNTKLKATDKRPIRHARPPLMTAAQRQTIQTAWPAFAERMKSTNQVPPVDDWHYLFDIAVEAREHPKMVIWLLNLMRETGVKPTAVTYEKALHVCALNEDRASAFHLVKLMFADKILLGDVELPQGMEDLLRKILPPEAFE